MKRASLSGVVVGCSLFALAPLAAQELVETFCQGTPQCSDDNLSISFEIPGGNLNVFSYTDFTPDMQIEATVRMNTVSMGIAGWSYAVRHTLGDLELASDAALTLEGTDAQAALAQLPFFQNRAVTVEVEGETRVGFISAVVLDIGAGINKMPLGNNSLLKATYTLLRDVGPEGTILRFANLEIGVPGSPLVDINIPGDTGTLLPRLLTHGLIAREGGCVPSADNEIADQTCADGIDNDCDGLIDDADPDCAVVGPAGCPAGTAANGLYFGAVGGDFQMDDNSVSILSRNDGPLLGFSFGVATDVQGNAQTWSFSSALGHNDINGNPVLVELNFTETDASIVIPEAGNTLTAASGDPITSIVRGAAIEGFADDDFFVVDLDPELGPDGFFVGYVTSLGGDLNRLLPVTPSPPDSCPANELLRITVGGAVRFQRGDANGDDKINLTDGILVIQNTVGNLPPAFPNCPAILDANGDGASNLADGVFLLNYVFRKDSPVPPAPFRTCEAGPGECAESNCGG